ncbi:MAG: hypothetical protein BGO67_10100 [Alphaproteobacteria bacterium 41-28]|nr:MAG: hypothetical protein BGO67_10100 [Alphaproteobacteria bacterium 41-28]
MLDDFLSPWVKNLEKSDIQKALQTTSKPDIISFSLGRPDNQLLALADFKEVIDELFLPSNLQYSPPSIELKVHIVELMKERGVLCTPGEVLLTTGAQQAMTLLSKLFVNMGESIIVDQYTYPGFIQVAQALHAGLIPIPVCFQQGLNIKELESILELNKKPRLLYTISEGHNPLGTSLSREQRTELISLVQRYQIPIIEDDAYGFLNYEKVEPPLKSYWREGIFYIGSFSKIFAPSLRIGWIIASEAIIEKLEILKEGFDINTCTLSQKLISCFFAKRSLKEHISKLKEKYKSKRDTMVAALKTHIPEMDFAIPKSGFFIWGRLPPSINTNRVFKVALEEEKVSFLPGSTFLIGNNREAQNCLRLSFAFCPIENIEPGVKRLALAIHESK